MNPKYRFFLQINDGEKIPVNPIYGDDMTLDYEMESNQRFYRAKLSGKFDFVRQDYALIMSAAFDSVYYLFIEKSNDWGQSWEQYYKSMFMRTDCTVNVDDLLITVQPQPIDQYNDVLAGLEKEYNLIALAPEIEPITINKRPLIQIYLQGESVISCFLSGLSWEQECEVVTNDTALTNTYHFAKNASIENMTMIQVDAAKEVPDGILNYPFVAVQEEGQQYKPTSNANGYFTLHGMFSDDPIVYIYAPSGNAIYKLEWGVDNYFVPIYDNNLSRLSYTGNLFPIRARYILDVETFNGNPTKVLSPDDMVGNNRNYRRAIGYTQQGVIVVSRNLSDTPTEYGRAPSGKYYAPPTTAYQQKYYPIIQSAWNNYSIWFAFHKLDAMYEESGRKPYILRDCYPVSSVISVLLKQFAPGITHEATPAYSEFLYGYLTQPIVRNGEKLFVTPKSNILNGEYQTPAQKSLTTLQQFLDMLRNTYQLYWHIEDNKLRIEHISWYRNGGQYGGSVAIGYDLTQLRNVKNGKEWAFATSEYKFDKEDMPERYQFAWMDDVTEPFDGQPIQVLSKYVQPGKIEEINIGGFTSDVDYMLLNPEAISQDGFALFGAVSNNGQYELPFVRYDIDNVTYYLQNGYLAMVLLQPQYWLYNMPARRLLVNNNEMWAYGIQRRKSQDITFPVGDNDPDVLELVKTNIGNGEIQKISINLSSRTAKATLKYDTE